MYKESEIGLEAYQKYYELVSLLKQKGTSPSKLPKLETLLNYFNDNFDNLNEEEEKLIKSVIMIATGITNKVNNCYGHVAAEKNACLTVISNLYSKQKEPTK